MLITDDEPLRRFYQGVLNETVYTASCRFRGREANRRFEQRFCWNEDCLIRGGSLNPRPFASTADISRKGIRIRYLGTPISPGLTVLITVKCLDVKSYARIIWSKAVNGSESFSGLRLSDPIPSYSISAVMRSRPFIPPLISSKRR